jgi:hypothetical protein
MYPRCMGCATRVRSGLTCGMPACEAALERKRALCAPSAREDAEFYGRVDAEEARRD